MRGWGYRFVVAASLIWCGCAGPESVRTRPEFSSPRGGVFQDPTPVVKSTHDDLLPSLVAGGPDVAYAAREEGNLDIYVRPIAGGAAVRLTTHPTDDTDPEYSPDGRRLVWTSQAEDVKGDLWVMAADGSDARRLTGRDTADRGATWSPDGAQLFFTARALDSESWRVEQLEVESGARRVLVEAAWDPAISIDGRYLFYVALDERSWPRLFVREEASGRVLALTDGAYAEGLPRVARGLSRSRIVFTRWVDDQTGDGVADVADAPSLWAVDFDPEIFADGAPRPAVPLTAGDGGEIFASVAGDWFAYTTAGTADAEIYALPADGVLHRGAGPQAILAAARAEENPALRRLGLRYLVATTPELASSARYELARLLAERGLLSDALDELARVAEDVSVGELALVARVEIERLRVLERLRGNLVVREDAERQFVGERAREIRSLAAGAAGSTWVGQRAELTLAEIDYALGQRQRAVAAFAAIGERSGVPAEDAARALDRLGEVYAELGDAGAVGRVSQTCIERFPDERFYARRAADRWVARAARSQALSPAAALEQIVREQAGRPLVAARAAVALAKTQQAAGHPQAALEQWAQIATLYTSERSIQADAWMMLGEDAERQGKRERAIDAYERILADFTERPELRSRALKGLTRLALETARQQERAGQLAQARESYARLLRNNRELIVAHRRLIILSARLDRLPDVLAEYRAAARANPRDKYARYGYGLALTFSRPPQLGAAEREIEAALGLDPRLAAGHLVLGWLREQRHGEDPRGGWLDRAAASFETAWSLLDPEDDPELWAGAKLNHGNVLMRLGKNDFAFGAFLQRELSQVPFDEPLTELIFRQRFAQVALRQEHFDVALDMARLGYELAVSLPGQPRSGTMAALNGAISLLTKSYEDAVIWYEKARQVFEAREDFERVVPALRGVALALQALGREDEALQTWQDLLRWLDQDRGPGELRYCWDKPAVRLLGLWIPLRLGFLDLELPANAESVTAAICGFSTAQEEEIARAQAARLLLERGDLRRAQRFQRRRLALLHEAVADSRRGDRLKPELLRASNQAAILTLRVGEAEAAAGDWREALALARALKAWAAAAEMLESVAELWLSAPEAGGEALREEALLAATTGLEQTAATDVALSGRFARWLALDHLRGALQPIAARGEQTERVESLFDQLDRAAEHAASAELYTRLLGGDEELRAAVGGHLQQIGRTPEAKRAAHLAAAPLDWRLRFERALWDKAGEERGPAPDWLRAAVSAFEQTPQPARAPETGEFLEAAVAMLVGANEVERAWQLLERQRLLELQPGPLRQGRPEVEVAWGALRAARSEPERYAALLAKAPALVRALEGRPAGVAEVQAVLDGRAVLVQLFAPTSRAVHFFAVDAFGVSYVRGEVSAAASVPELLLAHIPPPEDPAAPGFYLDAGHQLADVTAELLWAGRPLASQYPATEVLSATYLVAAREQRNLPRDTTATFGAAVAPPGAVAVPARQVNRESLASQGAGKQILLLGLEGTYQAGPPDRPGADQVTFPTARGTPVAERLDLDRLAGLSLWANVLLVDHLAAGARPARAVAQAALLAGIPATILARQGPLPAATVGALAQGLAEQRFIDAARELAGAHPGGARLFGDHGLDAREAVFFVAAEYLRLDEAGKAAFKRGQASDAINDWRAAQVAYGDALEALAFLRQPAKQEILAASDEAKWKSLASNLKAFEIGRQVVLAQVMVRLNEIDEAVALQDLVIASFLEKGDLNSSLKVLGLVGKNLTAAGRHAAAAERYQACLELSRRAKAPAVEADCLTQLASAKRELFDYQAAASYYLQAIALHRAANAPAEINVRRFLGFLYEGALNDYEQALDQFRQALTRATELEQQRSIPNLLLDVSRILRTRGDYEQALEQALAAEAQLGEATDKERADVALEVAKIYWYRGNYRRALERQRQGLELARQAKDTFRELQALSLEGLVALNQGELARAEEAINAALFLSRLTGRQAEEAKQLNNLGTILRQAGRFTEAVATFRQAMKLDEQLGSVEGRAYDLRNLAVALHRQGNHQEALTSVSEALALSRSIGEQYNQLQALFAAGEILDALGNSESAQRYQEAADLARQTSVPEVEWRSLYALGRLARGRGEASAARDLFRRALEVAERLGRGQAESATEFSRDDLYADAVALALQAGDLAGAHLLMERSRARATLDLLASRTIELPGPRAKQLLGAELLSREQLIAAERGVSLDQDGAAVRLQAAVQQHDDAVAQLKREFPRLARLFTISPLPLDQVQARLPERVVALAFHVGRAETQVLIVDRREVRHVTLPFGRPRLDETISALRRSWRAFGAVDQSLEELSAALLAPLAEWLTGASTIVIAADGPLHHLPFAALPLGSAPLLGQAVVSTTPSLSALAEQLALQSVARPAVTVAMAPAGDLPFAALEAQAVAPGRAILAGAATEEALHALRADALDLAAHAALDARDPLASAVELVAGSPGRDGRLELHEVFALGNLPPLVTLSACDTAVGDGHGAEWLGLGGAFFAAGVRTVIASTNRVSDLAAAVLMKRFYRQVRQRPTGEALRAAALTVRQYFPHPAHWASFVLLGDFR